MIDIKAIQPQFRKMVAQWLDQTPWIHGVGIGQKSVAGKTIAQDAVVFFVTTKLPVGKLDAPGVIPEWLEIHGLDGAIPTDVVQMPPLTFSCTVDRPAHGGDCIAPLAAPWIGTLGAALQKTSTGEKFILSASHTMRGIGGILPSDQLICHPNGASALIAQTTASSNWSTSTLMTGDVALARVFPGNNVEQTVNGIGALTGMARPVVGEAIQFSGRNGLKSGQVLYRDVIVKVDFIYKFENTVLVSALAQKGDSGSVVVNGLNEAVATVFADNNFVTACTELEAVKEEFRLGDYQF